MPRPPICPYCHTAPIGCICGYFRTHSPIGGYEGYYPRPAWYGRVIPVLAIIFGVLMLWWVSHG